MDTCTYHLHLENTLENCSNLEDIAKYTLDMCENCPNN